MPMKRKGRLTTEEKVGMQGTEGTQGLDTLQRGASMALAGHMAGLLWAHNAFCRSGPQAEVRLYVRPSKGPTGAAAPLPVTPRVRCPCFPTQGSSPYVDILSTAAQVRAAASTQPLRYVKTETALLLAHCILSSGAAPFRVAGLVLRFRQLATLDRTQRELLPVKG